MASASYSFIDIVVLDDVRQRFAAGDALVLLTDDLDTVIWANGPGAALIGNIDIMTAVGMPSGLALPARRQIMGSPGFHARGRSSQALVRIGGQAVTLTVSRLALPGGEAGILLSAVHDGVKDEIGAAQRSIAGFAEPDQYLAIVDQDAKVVAATEGFDKLDISSETLAELVAQARSARDRLVKRLVPGETHSLPAGIARLTDSPAVHLLVVVDEPVEIASPEKDEPAASVETVPQIIAVERQPEDQSQPSQPTLEKPQPAVRFLWRTDADGRFNTISDEFVEAAGILEDSIVGKTFRQIASELKFDADGEIAGLLERRDTWSGRTVMWPVEGGLRVPVDLAALPAYSRDRSFEGFRGFGVARFGDAEQADEIEPAVVAPQDELKTESPARPSLDDDDEWEDAPVEDDEFYGEVPVFAIPAERSEPPAGDKIIHLSERRQPTNDRGLSPIERNAFREIGDRLRAVEPAGQEATPSTPFGKRKVEDRPTETVDQDATVDNEQAVVAEEIHDATAPVKTSEPSKLQTFDGVGAAESTPALSADEQDLASLDGNTSEASPPDLEPVVAKTQRQDPVTDPDLQDLERLDHEPIEATAEAEATQQAAKPFDGEQDRETAKTPFEDIAPVVTEQSAIAAKSGSADTDAVTDPDLHDLERLDREPNETAAVVAEDRSEVGQLDAVTLAEAMAAETAILDRLPVPILIHSGDDLFYANLEFLSLTSYPSLDALAEAGGLDTLFADPLDDGEEGDGRELRLRRRDGVEFPIEALLRSVKWQTRSALMLVVRVAGDEGDDETPALAEARTRMAELRTIIDTATDGVVIIDGDGAIRSISRPAEALFGFDNDDLVGKPFTSLFAIESQGVAQEYLAGLADHGVASLLNDGRDVIGRESQGRFIPLFMTIGRMPNNSGYCAVLRDVTQWKRAEEELSQSRMQAEHASSQKTDFLARVSHEIRTPLNAIIGFSELMLDEKFGPVSNDRYRDYLRDINRSGNHVLDLVNDLLDISKIEAGEQEMAYEAISLNEALSEAVAIMQPQANRERVIIRSSFASKLPPVVADLRSVRQIALNVLSNAVRFTQAGGQVIISTAHEQSGDIVMRVRDTGIGMSQAEIEQALKPFKQINALKRPRGDGTGLGLPLTKAMVEANRARFVLTSAPGEGTLIEVVFPSTRVLAQ